MVYIIGQGYVALSLLGSFGSGAQLITNKLLSPADVGKALDHVGDGDVVINAAFKGSTAEIERLEEFSAEWNDHILVNVLLPEWIAILAAQKGFRFVHLSTLMLLQDWHGEVDWDDVQEGRGYDEMMGGSGSFPNLSAYARMKLLAEKRLLGGMMDMPASPSSTIVARIHLPFDGLHHPKNLLSKLQGFTSYATDQVSMTSLIGLATQLKQLFEQRVHGVLHFVCDQTISFYEVAQMMQAERLIPEGELPTTTLSEINAARNGAYQPRVVAYSSKLCFYEGVSQFPIRNEMAHAIAEYKRGRHSP